MRFGRKFALLMMGIGLACFIWGAIQSAIVFNNILIHGDYDKVWIAGFGLFMFYLGRYSGLKQDDAFKKLKDDIEGES